MPLTTRGPGVNQHAFINRAQPNQHVVLERSGPTEPDVDDFVDLEDIGDEPDDFVQLGDIGDARRATYRGFAKLSCSIRALRFSTASGDTTEFLQQIASNWDNLEERITQLRGLGSSIDEDWIADALDAAYERLRATLAKPVSFRHGSPRAFSAAMEQLAQRLHAYRPGRSNA